jgi:hypothetical protein
VEISVSATELGGEATPLLGLDQAAAKSNVDSSFENEEVAAHFKQTEPAKSGLARTASKGKEVMKSVGQAVKNSFKGGEKGTTKSVQTTLFGEKLGGGGGAGSAKLKQSTLSFAKVN